MKIYFETRIRRREVGGLIQIIVLEHFHMPGQMKKCLVGQKGQHDYFFFFSTRNAINQQFLTFL